MSVRHSEDCIYSGQTGTCDGSCTADGESQ